MALTETRVIKQIAILPAQNAINVQWANQIVKDDNVLSETFERKAYSVVDQLPQFSAEVGAIDINAFLDEFNAATLDEKAAAVAALAAEVAAHDTTKAELQTTQDSLAAKSAAFDTTAADLAAAQAQVAQLQADLAAAQAQIPAAPQAGVVTMRQARLALLQVGKLAAVDAAISGMSEPDRTAATIEWNHSTEVRRDWPLVIALGPALGLTASDLDDLFALAATL